MNSRTAWLGLAVLLPALGWGFDTGHHYDVTRHSCREWRFSEFSTKMLQLQNWLVDFYSNDLTFGKRGEVDLLHFDNLKTTKEVRAYWAYFTDNTRRALQAAATADDPFRALSILGMSLHAVQDFYTHSNWVELHPPNAGELRSITWFEDTPAPNDNRCYTGVYPGLGAPGATPLLFHGNYGYGLNHDSYSRPRFQEAYIFAYGATMQWMAATQKWVELIRPGFWNKMREYKDDTLNETLDADHYYLYRISEWVRKPTGNSDYIDGKWKGEFSGAATVFAYASLKFLSYTDAFSKEFTDNLRFRELITNLKNLKGAAIPAIEALPTLNLKRNAVLVRTTTVNDKTTFTMDAPLDSIDFDTLPDFFARLRVDGQDFTEACRQITRAGGVNWLTVSIIRDNRVNVNIHYELYDEDANMLPVGIPPVLTFFYRDEFCDINPRVGKKALDMVYSTATKKLSGDVNNGTNAFDVTGTDGFNCQVIGEVTHLKIVK